MDDFFSVKSTDETIIKNQDLIINKQSFLDILFDLEKKSDITLLRLKINEIKNIITNISEDSLAILNVSKNGDTIRISGEYLLGELKQIEESMTLERAKYYVTRLKKGITEVKTSKINDINLHRWKEYEDIITDSIWFMGKRDRSGEHIGSYWGNFIPQIPNQLLQRYTKKGEWVLDPFLGSGTTLIECKRLGRNGIGIELNATILERSKETVKNEKNPHNVLTETVEGDSTSIDYRKELEKIGLKSVQFLIMHPPYWDIISFSDDKRDLSNAKSKEGFLRSFGEIVDKTYPLLNKGRYFAVVIGDKYSAGEWIPLGFNVMNEVLKRKYMLKSIIVKNFDETKGKRQQKELWRYRALVGGFYIFKHEYIFLFKKL